MWKTLFQKISALCASHLDFMKKAFSDNGTPSSSRMLAIPHSLASIFVLVYLSVHLARFPGLDEATGLSAFATAPYAVNRVSNMFQKKDNGSGDPPPAQA